MLRKIDEVLNRLSVSGLYFPVGSIETSDAGLSFDLVLSSPPGRSLATGFVVAHGSLSEAQDFFNFEADPVKLDLKLFVFAAPSKAGIVLSPDVDPVVLPRELIDALITTQNPQTPVPMNRQEFDFLR